MKIRAGATRPMRGMTLVVSTRPAIGPPPSEARESHDPQVRDTSFSVSRSRYRPECNPTGSRRSGLENRNVML